MEPERLHEVEELYHAAVELERNQRGDFLREACGTDESLRREVESLLAYRSQAEDFIELPAMEVAAGALARDEVRQRQTTETMRDGDGPLPWMPGNIGRYRVLRLLGEGGMGVVYEAEQEQPRRTVALKVIKPGLASPEVLRRFAQESEALARLQHPGIAQIYEAGTADTGFGPQPYFAMELIRGHSLRDYAEEHRLNTRQRLELMVKICEAVQHAHQRGLIHRDLKPGNILVDETGQPKILDFGVARVTDSDAQATRQTDLGQLVGTLAYMSPEQVLADPLELDTRSDVYALGVILYELLAGRLPYHLSRQPHEAVQTIREEDPAPLSSISRNYQGDIQTIVAKALEKEKARRYGSAAGLASDIRHYLADEPITARPASASYQLKKFARRHKALVAAAAVVFAVLVGGIVASTREAARARQAEQTAQAVNDFLQNDLLAQASADTQAGPNTKPDRDLKVRTALDRAAAKIGGKFARQPVVEASIRQTIGTTYRDLGLYTEAQRQMERALELRRRVLGESHLDTLSSMGKLGEIYWFEGRFPQAEALYMRALDIGRRVRGEEHPDSLDILSGLGRVYNAEAKYPQAEALYTRALEILRRKSGEEHLDTATFMVNLGSLYRFEGKYAQAEPLLSKALEIRRRLSGEDHPETFLAMSHLGVVYLFENKYREAELLFSRNLEARRRVSGREHPYTLTAMSNLAMAYLRQGRYAEAETLDADALEIQVRTLGEEHKNTPVFMNNLAAVYRVEGKYVQAEALFAKTLEIVRRLQGDEHPDTLNVMHNLGMVYQGQAKYAQAEAILIKTTDARRRALGNKHPETLRALSLLGQVRLQQRKYSEAEATLREALSAYEETSAQAWHRYNCQSLLGASIAAQKRYIEAEPLLLAGYEGLLQRRAAIGVDNLYSLEDAQKAIVQLYQDWAKPWKAAEWKAKFAARPKP
jgi:predicted Ser/Thr protein kinase